MLKFFPLILTCSLFLSGCANMDKSMCLAANWQTIGFEDGAAGRPQTEIAQHRKDCAKHGITPDLTAYRTGHHEGSVLFCTDNNGFRHGSAGKNYQNSCPEALANAFLSGFKDGEELYQAQGSMNHAQSNLNYLLNDISKLQTQIDQQTEMMIADGLTRDERAKIRDDIALMQADLAQLYGQRSEFEQQVATAKFNYERTLRRFSRYN